ncbi:InlB B-repeat-containing protein [Proteiniclasticum ruminis]|uniref:InlB B-repeat-containing protein n=1 Tax=Proteiniclasticum ruminis TaxID=398199 RepID=UPI0028A72767|nr:InlB B-repeat-containing protein [Proteiniclasticum ruminis]
MNGLLRRVAVVVVTVFMFTLVPSGTAVSGIPGGFSINLGFEDGLVGWVSNGADVSIAGTRTVSPWNVLAHGSNMAILEPDGISQFGIASLAKTLQLSNQSVTYLENNFVPQDDMIAPGINNYAYIYQDISMNSGDQLTFSWNYVSTDYVPFNDGSIASMTYVGNSNVYPKINGVFTQVSILGATVPGTGNYSTGDYGSTGWQSITMEATVPGLYRIGFATFNLDDYDISPVLFVDNAAGTTLNNGVPFGPISPDDNPPPSFKVSTLTYSSKTFTESPDDDGSIESKITVSIDNDTFTGDIGEVFEPVTFSNIPAGLTAKAVKTGDKTIEISFEGDAIQHAVQNTVSNVTAAFSNDAFTIYGINETSNTVTKDLKIEFKSFGSVHFETGGGSSVDTLRIEKGTSIAKPADPIRAGYTFLGWYSTAFETSPYNFSSIFTEDSITLHARWTPNTNTIFSIEHYQEKINGTGYELIDTEYLTGTTEDPATASPKSYIGFSHDPDHKMTVSSGEIQGDGTLILKLYYDRLSYDYTFKNWNDEVLAAGSIPYGDVVPVPEDPIKEGYAFTGWSGVVPEFMPAESISVKAEYAINSYTLSFNSNGGSPIASITKEYGDEVGTVADPVREGYLFRGWSPAIPKTVPAKDSSYVAEWAINQYVVYFEENGGSTVVNLRQDYNTLITYPIKSIRAGYTFEGWFTDGGLTNEWNFEEDRFPARDFTLYAKWSANTDTKYVVNHYKEKLDGTFELVDEEQLAGITDTAVSATAKSYTGFTVDRTHEDEVATGIIDGSKTLVLSLYYQRDSFNVVFRDWDGTLLKEVTLKYESGAKAPTGMTREGYTFTHWDQDFSKVTENLEVKAIYKINQYDIFFEENGGSEVGDLRQDFDTYIENAPVTVKAGYIFEGWFVDEDFVALWNFEGDKVPANHVTLYAKWTVRTDTLYTVKHYKEALDRSYVEFETD